MKDFLFLYDIVLQKNGKQELIQNTSGESCADTSVTLLTDIKIVDVRHHTFIGLEFPLLVKMMFSFMH